MTQPNAHPPTAHPPTDPHADPPEGVLPEVRTRRLVVTDGAGRPRITGHVTEGGVAELFLALPDGADDRASVLLFANPGDDAPEGPTLGLQLWAAGDAMAEMNLWWEGNRWRASTHVEPEASSEG